MPEQAEMSAATRQADRDLLSAMFRAAVSSAQPGRVLARFLPDRPAGRTVVIGAGKASGEMAQKLEELWQAPLSGCVVVPHGTYASCRQIEVRHAAHPVPDAQGAAAADRIFDVVSDLTEDDLVIALMSGGGSALLPAPASGLTLADEQAINEALLRSGADIAAMNLIRNQFSRIKGGRLAQACRPARVVSLIVSDVPGDDASLVASGPTVPMSGRREEAQRLVALYDISLPPAAVEVLNSPDNPAPSSDDAGFAGDVVHIIASAAASLDAAAKLAARAGVTPYILSDGIEGEASAAGQTQAAIAREVALRNRPFTRPCVLLSGGETTVTVRGAGGGRGGRNSEFMLGIARGIERIPNIVALAADTDGVDGSGDAGAYCDGDTTTRMRRAGIDPLAALRGNDSYAAFAASGDLFETGPTGTNVNDFRAILIR